MFVREPLRTYPRFAISDALILCLGVAISLGLMRIIGLPLVDTEFLLLNLIVLSFGPVLIGPVMFMVQYQRGRRTGMTGGDWTWCVSAINALITVGLGYFAFTHHWPITALLIWTIVVWPIVSIATLICSVAWHFGYPDERCWSHYVGLITGLQFVPVFPFAIMMMMLSRAGFD